jgi:hypothetical protein
VVRLDDGGVEARERGGGPADEAGERGDAERSIRRDEDGAGGRLGAERGERRGRERGGADEERCAGAAREVDGHERALIIREIDDNIRENAGEWADPRRCALRGRVARGGLADAGRALALDRADEVERRVVVRELAQARAHAARGAVDNQARGA